MEIPGEEKREKRNEKAFETIMTENFIKLMSPNNTKIINNKIINNTKIQIQETQRISRIRTKTN